MKKPIGISLILVVLVFLIPWLGGESTPQPDEQTNEQSEVQAQPEDLQSELPTQQKLPPTVEHISTGELDSARRITVLMDGYVVEMDLPTPPSPMQFPLPSCSWYFPGDDGQAGAFFLSCPALFHPSRNS